MPSSFAGGSADLPYPRHAGLKERPNQQRGGNHHNAPVRYSRGTTGGTRAEDQPVGGGDFWVRRPQVMTGYFNGPKTFVVITPGNEVTLEEIQALVSENLVSYQQIRLLELIDAIPKRTAGKTLRKELRNR
jgi:acyl-CoA synthetase (AMP-forming)/AMP-acid ligase II